MKLALISFASVVYGMSDVQVVSFKRAIIDSYKKDGMSDPNAKRAYCDRLLDYCLQNAEYRAASEAYKAACYAAQDAKGYVNISAVRAKIESAFLAEYNELVEKYPPFRAIKHESRAKLEGLLKALEIQMLESHKISFS